jgi:predicted nucleotidyltransferase
VELSRPLSTVTPTLDGDVLAVLARSTAAFTTGQLVRVLDDPSETGIRKVLQRLTQQGIVQSTRVGNAYSYQLNRDHLAAQHIIGLAQVQEELLKRLEERLSAWTVPPVYAAVFGSAADGSMTVDSDLDLLLVYPSNADDDLWRRQVDELADDVTRWTGNDTRPLELSEGEIASGLHWELVFNVLDRSLTVAGNAAWLEQQIKKGR